MACRLAEPTSATKMMRGKHKHQTELSCSCGSTAGWKQNHQLSVRVRRPMLYISLHTDPPFIYIWAHSRILSYQSTVAKDKNNSFLSEKCNKFNPFHFNSCLLWWKEKQRKKSRQKKKRRRRFIVAYYHWKPCMQPEFKVFNEWWWHFPEIWLVMWQTFDLSFIWNTTSSAAGWCLKWSSFVSL